MTQSWKLACATINTWLDWSVRHVVLSPGSRNSALAMALADAESAGEITLHVRIDERVAGFTALGIAKATGQPVPVVTTSGTAVGNLAPAMMEAWHAQVPVVAVTADRPHSMIGSGSNQTTHQYLAFRHTVFADDIPDHQDSASVRSRLSMSMAHATGVLTGRPGPVHCNIHFEQPLIPDPCEIWGRDPHPPLVADRPSQSGARWELDPQAKAVIVVGDTDPGLATKAIQVARDAQIPLLAEPSSHARGPEAIASYPLLLEHLGSQIDQVIMVGHPTLSRAVIRLLSQDGTRLVAWTDSSQWVDPTWRVDAVVKEVNASSPCAHPEWLETWRRADAAVSTFTNQANTTRPTGLSIANLVVDNVGNQPLMIGSSAIIRDFNLAHTGQGPLNAFANRGLAGIDGNISTAMGLAIGFGQPVTLICGDLTFRHDAPALSRSVGEPVPDLRIIVVDDGGGSIFTMLEPGKPEYASRFARVFTTAQSSDCAKIAEGYSVPTRTVSSLADLAEIIQEPVEGVEVIVVDVDGGYRRDEMDRFAAFAAEYFGSIGQS